MKKQVLKDKDIKNAVIVYSVFDETGFEHNIKAMSLHDYGKKGSKGRKEMAKILRMLRQHNYLVTELYATQHLAPIEYFQKLKADGLKLYAITYFDLNLEEKDTYDVYGLSTHNSHHLGNFFFRIYDREYYQKVLDILLPLIKESGIICEKSESINSGDSRR